MCVGVGVGEVMCMEGFSGSPGCSTVEMEPSCVLFVEKLAEACNRKPTYDCQAVPGLELVLPPSTT